MKQPYLSIYQKISATDIIPNSGSIVSINCNGITFDDLMHNIVGECQIFGGGTHPAAVIDGILETENLGIEIIHIHGIIGMVLNDMMDVFDFTKYYSINAATSVKSRQKLDVPRIVLSMY